MCSLQPGPATSSALLVRIWLTSEGETCARLMHVDVDTAGSTRTTCAGTDAITSAFVSWLHDWSQQAELVRARDGPRPPVAAHAREMPAPPKSRGPDRTRR